MHLGCALLDGESIQCGRRFILVGIEAGFFEGVAKYEG
jgi:hypothetical protein